jgi:hypothetical protein
MAVLAVFVWAQLMSLLAIAALVVALKLENQATDFDRLVAC